MPITAWLCPHCNRETPLDHFITSECGEKIPSDYASAVLASRNGHQSGVVEVSHGIGCPRRYLIEQTENFAVNPLDLNSPESGTAWHSHMEKHSTDPQHTEVQLKGVISGVEVHGRTDRIDPERKLVIDHKNVNDFQVKYLKSEGVKPDHRAQLSLYAELIDQQFGWRPRIGLVFYHAAGSGFYSFKVGLSALEDVLAYKPVSGEYTVEQLLHQTDDAMKGLVSWLDLPLVGQTQMYGSKTACDYCAVRSVCTIAAYSAPF